MVAFGRRDSVGSLSVIRPACWKPEERGIVLGEKPSTHYSIVCSKTAKTLANKKIPVELYYIQHQLFLNSTPI